jgi:large subunit ribosomal protein L9
VIGTEKDSTMARTVELLLIENVEGSGIVGDVVKVRKGFARNYLMPRGMATQPSPEKIKELAGKRADAEKQIAALRQQREALIKKLDGYKLEMIRSCNDLGILYGAITQHEISIALGKAGFPGIKDREVRIGTAMKRIDTYDLDIKFAADLVASIKLDVKADRVIDLRRAATEEPAPAPVDGEAAPAEGAAPGEKKAGKKGDKADKGDKSAKVEAPSEKKGVWASAKNDSAEPKAEAKAEKSDKADKGEPKAKKAKPAK